jgi:hypothetical protein
MELRSGRAGGEVHTHYGDSARGREGADGARALAEGVPEHVFQVCVASCGEGKQLQSSCNCTEGGLRRGVDGSLGEPT